jgi:hypothetical protein
VLFISTVIEVEVKAGEYYFIRQDGGETWSAQTSGTDRNLRSVFFLDQDTGWVAGGEKGILYSMVAEGSTFPGIWEVNFTVPSEGWIQSIDFSGNDYGVFNSSIAVNSEVVQLIYHSANGGENWAAPDSIYGLLSATLSVGDAQNVWIGGSAGQSVKSVYVGDFHYSYELDGLDHLDGGVYFLRMKSADGQLNSTRKIVKY